MYVYKNGGKQIKKKKRKNTEQNKNNKRNEKKINQNHQIQCVSQAIV